MKLRPISLLLPAFLAMIAASMGLGSLHDFQNADSLVPVLVSIQHWTPFYWGQDRFGMLVPLLAMPVRNPLGNLLVQGWLMSVAALMAPFVETRYLGVRDWFIAGTLANILFLLVAPKAVQFDWLVTQPYALSIALGFGSLFLIEDAANVLSRPLAIGLMLLANWVDAGFFVILCPAVVVTGRSCPEPFWRAFAIIEAQCEKALILWCDLPIFGVQFRSSAWVRSGPKNHPDLYRASDTHQRCVSKKGLNALRSAAPLRSI